MYNVFNFARKHLTKGFAMYKKIGVVILSIILLSTVFIPSNSTALASSCTSITDCRNRQRTVRDNIATIIAEEEELSMEIADIRNDIANYRAQIAVVEDEISYIEYEMNLLSQLMEELGIEIAINVEILEITEEEILILLDEIAQRMRVTQHLNNRNSMLTLISESESFVDLIRRTRFFTSIAIADADLMEQLNDLVDFQDALLIELNTQREDLEIANQTFSEMKEDLQIVRGELLILHTELTNREYNLLEKMYALGQNRVDEEARLAALIAAEEILERTPPPPVQTPGGGSSNSSTGNPQTPNESGLAHPMPGANVTSRFGPRWGGHHAGIDLQIWTNMSAPILAAASGTVTHSTFESGMGWYVVISHNINGQRVDTLYGHLRYQPLVSVGDTVSQGQQIGVKGSTGFSTGPHLHFEVHPGGFRWNSGVNPELWINF